MNFEPDDPRLTAYALGELTPPESAAVENELLTNDAARRAVAEIRATAQLLEQEYGREAHVGLDAARRNRILQKAGRGMQLLQNDGSAAGFNTNKKIFYYRAFSLVAASALIGIVIYQFSLHPPVAFGDKDRIALLESSDEEVEKRATYKGGLDGFANNNNSKITNKSQAPAEKSRPSAVPTGGEVQQTAETERSLAGGDIGRLADDDKIRVTGARTELDDIEARSRKIAGPGNTNKPIVNNPGRRETPAPARDLNTTNQNALPPGAPTGGGGGGKAAEKKAGEAKAPTELLKSGGPDDGEKAKTAPPAPAGDAQWRSQDAKKDGETQPKTPALADSNKKETGAADRALNDSVTKSKDKNSDTTKDVKNLKPGSAPLRGLSGGNFVSVTNSRRTQQAAVQYGFVATAERPLSSFSIEPPGASYREFRRAVDRGELPRADTVRAGDWINYFSYNDPAPARSEPVALFTEIAACPWNTQNRLLRISLRTADDARDVHKQSNLTIISDVTRAKADARNMNIAQQSLKMLLNRFGENDSVAIVENRGSIQKQVEETARAAASRPGSRFALDESKVALAPTSAKHKDTILRAIDNIGRNDDHERIVNTDRDNEAPVAETLQTGYRVAEESFNKNADNPVLLVTDRAAGADDQSLRLLAEAKARAGLSLSILNFDPDPRGEEALLRLAKAGNGYYNYIDSISELQKALDGPVAGAPTAVARDVEMAVEFNRNEVASYRLLDYQNGGESLAFDGGAPGEELEAGRRFCILYEIEPSPRAAESAGFPSASTLLASDNRIPQFKPGEICNVSVRYKLTNGTADRAVAAGVRDTHKKFSDASEDFQFSAAVAALALALADGPAKGGASIEMAYRLASGAISNDPLGHRREFLNLLERAKTLANQKK